MSEGRERNGRFGVGNRANPAGRPKKRGTVDDAIMRELTAPVTITENQRRRRVPKLAATAKQLANQGASGDPRSIKLAIELARKIETERTLKPAAPPLTSSDQAIAERLVLRLREQIERERMGAHDDA